jgi:hypothetical protein
MWLPAVYGEDGTETDKVILNLCRLMLQPILDKASLIRNYTALFELSSLRSQLEKWNTVMVEESPTR